MSEQLDLLSDPGRDVVGKFQRPGAAAITQRIAAVEMTPLTGKARMKVLFALADSLSGMTDEEMQADTGMNPSTQRPRRVELAEGGWVEDSGRKRLTKSGRLAVVWTVTAVGRDQLATLEQQVVA